MAGQKVLEYFDSLAGDGRWDSLYNQENPKSYSFIVRLKKSLEMIEEMDNKSVCDMGCGTGVLIPFVINSGGNYTGIDNSPEMLEFVRHNYNEKIKSGEITIINSDFEKLDHTSKFDICIGLGFIEYFDDPSVMTKKIFCSLCEGGQLILSFPNLLSLDYFVLQILSPLRAIARKLFKKSTVQPPRKLWTVKKAKEMLGHSGYKDLKVVNYSINFFFYPFSRFFPRFCNAVSKHLEYSFVSRFGFFSTGFIISAKK